MALEGSIEEFGLPEIFQMILLQKKEGVLKLTHEKTTLSIEFSQGQIISAGDEEQEARLADNLIKAEKINGDQLKALLRTQKRDNQSFAQALVQSGHFTAEEVRKINRTLTEETVFSLFEWKTGSYKFEAKDVSYDSELVEPLNTDSILMEGATRTDEWPLLKKRVPSTEMVFEALPKEPPPAPADNGSEKREEDSFESMGDPSEPEEEPEEEEEGAWLLPWIDGNRTVQEIIDHAQMGTFPVYKALSELISQGRIKAKEESLKNQRKKSHYTFKELSRQQQVIRIAVNSIAIAALAVISVVVSRSVYLTLSSAIQPISQMRTLRTGIERDSLLFALDLYYLRHGRYPNSLQNLKEEGLLNSRRERQIDLTKWKYELSGNTFNLSSL
jgi:competence protein ComGC